MVAGTMTKILITGCSTGIGFNLATVASKRGHEVVATMRALETRNADNAARLRAACEAGPGSVHIVELDVTNDDSVAAAMARAQELVGELDAVVHNAGVGSLGLMETFTVEQMREVFEVNVFGAHRIARAALPAMRARGSGLLVFLSSAIGRVLFPYFGAYGPSKFALEALAEGYANELRPTGVEVSIVQPGGFATPFFANASQPDDQDRVASYGEIAQVAAQFYSRPESSPPMPEPDILGIAITELIELAPGTRPLRQVVDPLMGEAIEAINQSIAAIQGPILKSMGLE